MNRYTPRNSIEFEKRQLCFPFGEACRFVAALTAIAKKEMLTWWRKNRPRLPQVACRIWQQLVLEANDFHQIPLFGFTS
jgi:hypothetical protein